MDEFVGKKGNLFPDLGHCQHAALFFFSVWLSALTLFTKVYFFYSYFSFK